ncbi:hypothetical protein [Croceicoccus hydrothermalis]|uniref:hypothetical protein n=1 Tax=Croceicoccus hydrothermalis TaxID=2867964 RepID=UPI001EFC29E7|nr:hypothetical protein [Croceicoccus hydrothermalis]
MTQDAAGARTMARAETMNDTVSQHAGKVSAPFVPHGLPASPAIDDSFDAEASGDSMLF